MSVKVSMLRFKPGSSPFVRKISAAYWCVPTPYTQSRLATFIARLDNTWTPRGKYHSNFIGPHHRVALFHCGFVHALNPPLGCTSPLTSFAAKTHSLSSRLVGPRMRQKYSCIPSLCHHETLRNGRGSRIRHRSQRTDWPLQVQRKKDENL